MSEDSSTGDVSLPLVMVEASMERENSVEVSDESVEDAYEETLLKDLELAKNDSGNLALLKSESVNLKTPKTAIFNPIPEGSEFLSVKPDDLAINSGQDFSLIEEHKEPIALLEFENVYSKEQKTPSSVVQEIVKFLEHTRLTTARVRAQKDQRIEELEKRVQNLVESEDYLLTDIDNHKDTVKDLKDKNTGLEELNLDLKEIIQNQNKKWDEVEKQLRAHPEISFSFVSLDKQTTSNSDNEDAQVRFETEEDQTTEFSGTPKGHKRTPSTTTDAEILPLTLGLEAEIARLKVINLFGRARDTFLEKNPNETLALAQEISEICHTKGLGKERTLVARGLFWKAQAQGQLKMWTEAHSIFKIAITMGLGPYSDCLEGDQIEQLMIDSRGKSRSGETETSTGTSEKHDGGTPSMGSLVTSASEKQEDRTPSTGSLVTSTS